MTSNPVQYDCAIIGGGLAGLCLSIQLAKLGHNVVVFEKNKYPFHKVCGEYVSNESFGFLMRMGLKLDEWDLPQINKIGISSLQGYMFNARLDLGGFGISRFKLDNELVMLARNNGVTVLDQTKVTDVKNSTVSTNKGDFAARICIGAFGKANPVFVKEEQGLKEKNNYIGVKYHIRTDMPADRIELHNFDNGYCGVSRIENDSYCLCYLSHSTNLRRHGNDIREMEKKVLRKNPYLEKIFSSAEFVFDSPLTVSNIKFSAKRTNDASLIYIGDAAGCISPLTGNGMSMSGYASVVLCDLIDQFIRKKIDRTELASRYQQSWNGTFLPRINRGRRLQYLFGQRYLSDVALRVLDPFTKLKTHLIRSTHGVPF